MSDISYRPRTRLVHAGQRRSHYGETSEAIYLTQGFVYPDAEAAEARFKGELAEGEEGFIYSRYGNPTVAMFEDRIAALEGAEAAFATASGMAAVNAALMCQLKAGDHVVAARALFGSCLYIVETLCPRFGETPSNPTLEIIDVKGVAGIVHEVGARLVVDNVFATPLFQRPLELGADVVVYSATKHIDGQGRCLGGVVLGTERFIRDEVEPYVKHTGPALSPFNAWVMLKGLETLTLRCHAQTDGAEALAGWMTRASKLTQVIYPGLPTHPQHNLALAQMERSGTTTTHQRLTEEARLALGITPGLVRLSVGLEDPEDLREDLATALAVV
jgi:O-succinylhomoserine sulfhydrylase